VIYFAGHGLRNGGSEIWLLSGAPNNASEAISVEASVMAARESGLASVVFISDACRSIPSGQQNNCLVGGSIFPNEALNRRTRPEIDRLFATLPSLVAVEMTRRMTRRAAKAYSRESSWRAIATRRRPHRPGVGGWLSDRGRHKS